MKRVICPVRCYKMITDEILELYYFSVIEVGVSLIRWLECSNAPMGFY